MPVRNPRLSTPPLLHIWWGGAGGGSQTAGVVMMHLPLHHPSPSLSAPSGPPSPPSYGAVNFTPKNGKAAAATLRPGPGAAKSPPWGVAGYLELVRITCNGSLDAQRHQRAGTAKPVPTIEQVIFSGKWKSWFQVTRPPRQSLSPFFQRTYVKGVSLGYVGRIKT